MPRHPFPFIPHPGRDAGFGLVDALIALALLAVALLGACGSLHFALRATRAAALQARAVDLIADLDEELLRSGRSLPLAASVEPWSVRLQNDLPAAGIAGMNARNLLIAGAPLRWVELHLQWNGAAGNRRQSLQLPLVHGEPP